jgi:serine protease AprX
MEERGWWGGDDVSEVADAFDAEHSEGVPVPDYGGEEDSVGNGALGIVIGASATIIVLLSVAVVMLWVWAEVEDVNIGGPPSALLTWEDEYRSITGLDAVQGDGTGVILCIVDSGIDMGHPDLEDIELSGWLDAIDGATHPYDDEGHGTAMAGIIVARDGLQGNAPGVSLLVAKAIGEGGTGDDEQISEAVDWCADNQADIISLSLGGDQGFGSGFLSSDALEESVEDAIDEGVFVVAAAGNDGEDDDGDVESPGSVDDVICVGGITRAGSIWTGSSEGDNNGRIWPNPILPRDDPDKKPEVVAPAHEVPVLMAGGMGNGAWWGWSSGTSAATAWVSGALAIVLEANPEMQREGDSGGASAVAQMKSVIMQNSQMQEGQSEHDNHYGYGILRVDLLMQALGNESAVIVSDGHEVSPSNFGHAIFDELQARRSTASVPPVNSTKPKE